MSQLSKAQRFRLGVFLLVALALVAGSIALLVGSALIDQRDTYQIYFEDSVSGLEPGASVKYNGIHVGRVEGIRVAPDDVSKVEVTVTLTADTPVKADAFATLSLQGITGNLFVELAGGTNAAETLAPGSTIQSKPSMLGALLERASRIAINLDKLTGNLVELTEGDNAQLITATLTDAQAVVHNVRTIVETAGPRINSILANVDDGTAQFAKLVRDARSLFIVASRALETAATWVNASDVSKLMTAATAVARAANRRLSEEELGRALAEYTELAKSGREFVDTANVTVLRSRDDLLRALDEFVNGAESFSEFAAILRDDPSALIRGRTQAQRSLP